VLHQDDLGDGVFLGSQADVLMLTRPIIALALSLLTGGVAEAQVWRSGGAFGVFRSVGTVEGNFPLDGFATQPTACYSERRLRSAYAAGLGIRIVRASDSAQLDIGFASGLPDTAAETAHCAATTCKSVTIYDQCGSRPLTQPTDASRFTRAAAGLGGFLASEAVAGTQSIRTDTATTPATGLVSLAAVAKRTTGTGICGFIRQNGGNNQIQARSVANQIRLAGGAGGTIDAAATDATWHAMAGVINAASSVFNVDGAETGPGSSPTGNTTAVASSTIGANTTTCLFIEGIIWDNYALTLGERTYLNNAARIAWGF
jgi:hypothetical protein